MNHLSPLFFGVFFLNFNSTFFKDYTLLFIDSSYNRRSASCLSFAVNLCFILHISVQSQSRSYPPRQENQKIDQNQTIQKELQIFLHIIKSYQLLSCNNN